MTETREGVCEQTSRMGCGNSGTLFKVPFAYGTPTRLSPEWWCRDCIEEDDWLEIGEDGAVYSLDDDGNRLATTEQIKEAYLKDHEKFKELVGWT